MRGEELSLELASGEVESCQKYEINSLPATGSISVPKVQSTQQLTRGVERKPRETDHREKLSLLDFR